MIKHQSRPQGDDPRGYRIFGYGFSLSVTERAVATRLAEILRPFAVSPVAPGNAYRLAYDRQATADRWQLTLDGTTLMGSPSRDDLVEHLLWHVNTHALKHAPGRLLVHAGSVVAPGGGAVILVGASGAGKSTLVTALVRAGWGYLSDELAVIDPVRHVVEPHPRPIHLKRGSPALPPGHVSPDSVTGAWHLPAEQVRRGALAEAQPVRAIVRLDPRGGARPTMTVLSPGEAAAALAKHVLNPDDHRGTLLPLIRDLALGALSLALSPGDLSASVTLLTGGLGHAAATSSSAL